MAGVAAAPCGHHQGPQAGAPAAVVAGGIAAGVTVAALAAHVVGGDGSGVAQIGDMAVVDVAVVAAVEQVVAGFQRHVPGVAHTGVVIRLVGTRLTGEDALRGGGRGGELVHSVAPVKVLVPDRQVEGDESGVVLTRLSRRVDVVPQVEQAGQVAQHLAEEGGHTVPLLSGVQGTVLHQVP